MRLCKCCMLHICVAVMIEVFEQVLTVVWWWYCRVNVGVVGVVDLVVVTAMVVNSHESAETS